MVTSDVQGSPVKRLDTSMSTSNIFIAEDFNLENGTGQGKGYWIYFIFLVIFWIELKPVSGSHTYKELKWQLHAGRLAHKGVWESGAW